MVVAGRRINGKYMKEQTATMRKLTLFSKANLFQNVKKTEERIKFLRRRIVF